MKVRATIWVDVPDKYLEGKIDSLAKNEAQFEAMRQLSWILYRGNEGWRKYQISHPIKLISLVMPDSPEPEITGTVDLEKI